MFLIGYAALFNQNLSPSIKIGKEELLGFSADSVWGSHKAYARIESALYTSRQLMGFRFTLFFGLGTTGLDYPTCSDYNALFYGITAGIRTRNENLIFCTMEIRLTYIPPNDETSG